jgi:hypothetical protein
MKEEDVGHYTKMS